MTTCSRAETGAWFNYPFLTSKERDIETGLDYFLARYYSNVQGRFTSPDEFKGGPEQLFYFEQSARTNPTFYAELEEPQTLNKYQYAINNPLRYVDPDGHQAMADSIRQAGAQWEASAPPQLKIVGRAIIIVGVAAGLLSKIESPSPCIGGLDCSAYYVSKQREQANQARDADNSAKGESGGQQQGQSNAASPGNNNDEKPPFGSKGTQTTSTTVYNGRGKGSTWRIQTLDNELGRFTTRAGIPNCCMIPTANLSLAPRSR